MIERRAWVGIDAILEDSIDVFAVLWHLGFHLELAQSQYDGLRRVDEVFDDGESIEQEFVLVVAILVNDLHLLDDGGFARFSGAEEEDLAFLFEFAAVLFNLLVDGYAAILGLLLIC